MQDFLLFTGDDELALKREALEMASSVKASFGNETAFEVINADKEGQKPLQSLENFLNALDTPPFLCEKRGIWLKHVNFFDLLDSKKNSELKDMVENILNSLEAELHSGITKVLIDGPYLSKKNLLYKFFEKNGKIFEFNKVKADRKSSQNEIFPKIKEYLGKYKKIIPFDAAEYIAATVGADSGRLYNELNKIIAYTGNNNIIKLEDCKAICSKTFDMASWTFAEAISNRNKKEAFMSLNILLDKVNNDTRNSRELSMLYSAARKIKDIMKIKSAAEIAGINGAVSYQKFQNIIETSDKNNLPEVFTSTHPYRAYKLYEQSLKFNEEFLSDIFSQLLDANIDLVSGALNKRLVMENLIVRIC